MFKWNSALCQILSSKTINNITNKNIDLNKNKDNDDQPNIIKIPKNYQKLAKKGSKLQINQKKIIKCIQNSQKKIKKQQNKQDKTQIITKNTFSGKEQSKTNCILQQPQQFQNSSKSNSRISQFCKNNQNLFKPIDQQIPNLTDKILQTPVKINQMVTNESIPVYSFKQCNYNQLENSNVIDLKINKELFLIISSECQDQQQNVIQKYQQQSIKKYKEKFNFIKNQKSKSKQKQISLSPLKKSNLMTPSKQRSRQISSKTKEYKRSIQKEQVKAISVKYYFPNFGIRKLILLNIKRIQDIYQKFLLYVKQIPTLKAYYNKFEIQVKNKNFTKIVKQGCFKPYQQSQIFIKKNNSECQNNKIQHYLKNLITFPFKYIPSINQIKKFIQKQKFEFQYFTIFNQYGSLQFQEKIDIRKIDMSQILILRSRIELGENLINNLKNKSLKITINSITRIQNQSNQDFFKRMKKWALIKQVQLNQIDINTGKISFIFKL